MRSRYTITSSGCGIYSLEYAVKAQQVLEWSLNPAGIVILPGRKIDRKYDFLEAFYLYKWTEEGLHVNYKKVQIDGLRCHLCKDEIFLTEYDLKVKDTYYQVIFLEELLVEPYSDFVGGLQCKYCLNWFHKTNCSFRMSVLSYAKSKLKRDYSCPLCVKEFRPQDFYKGSPIKRKVGTDALKIKIIVRVM